MVALGHRPLELLPGNLPEALQNRGFTIVQVEYRTSQRFDGTPLNALADAYKAIDWTIANAANSISTRKTDGCWFRWRRRIGLTNGHLQFRQSAKRPPICLVASTPASDNSY